MTDFELLRSYASSGSEADFAALVGRYANLVYSAALRQTLDPHDAEEISQIVFVILARKAGAIGEGTVLAGWLLRTTRFVAQNAQRKKAHRQRTEREAMSAYLTETDSAWQQIAPLLDEALAHLNDKDRDAVVLRFFEHKSFREIGHILGTSEDNAQKRVSRALGKLRDICVKRGVVVPATIFTVAITANAVQAAPGYLAATAVSTVTAGTAAAGSISTGVKATLAALEQDRIKTLGLRISKAALVLLMALFASYLFWPTTVPRSTSGLGATRTEPIPPQPTSPALAGGTSAIATANLRQLRLRVIDSQTETPLSNVRVTAKWGIMPYPLKNETVTDVQGECVVSFNLEVKEFWVVLIQVIRDGYVPRFVSWAEPRGDLVEDIPTEYTIKLTLGQVIGGLAFSDSGDPVPDAKLVFDGPSPSFFLDGPPEREGLAVAHTEGTDAQGRWLCNHMPPEMEKIYFNVLHPDHVAARFDVAKSQDASNPSMNWLLEQDLRRQTATIILKRGRVVTGVVVDEKGNPIRGAKVTRDRAWSDPSAKEVTATVGSFRFANIAKPELILTVQADGFVAQDKTIDLTTITNALRFELSRAAVLRGMVVDERNKPISKASVTARGGDYSNDRFEGYALSDAQGKFAWRSVPPSHKHYDVFADGFISATNLELVANGEEHRITLRKFTRIPRFRISGRVTDADTKQPIDSFQVWVGQTLASGAPGSSYTTGPVLRTTGTGGKFALMTSQQVNLTESYAVEIRAEGYSATSQSVPGQTTNGYDLSFALNAEAGLTGIVQSPDGTPIDGAVILVCTKPEGQAYMRVPGQLDLSLSRGNHTETDTNGMFTILTAKGTDPVFIVHKSGYAEMPVAQLLASHIQRLQPWGRVAGLLMIGSQPATNETVWLGNAWPNKNPASPQAILTATTDVDGHFTLDGLPPGEWSISHQLRRRGEQPGIYLLTQTLRIQVSSGQLTQVKLGGAGRKAVGKIRISAAGQPFNLEGYLLRLTSELPGIPFPSREQFGSDAAYDNAIVFWPARRFEFQASPAGRAFRGNTSEYPASVEADGSFAINDVLPGGYGLSVEFDPGRVGMLNSPQPDLTVMKQLISISRKVIVPEAIGDEAAPVDLGILEPNLNKP